MSTKVIIGGIVGVVLLVIGAILTIGGAGTVEVGVNNEEDTNTGEGPTTYQGVGYSLTYPETWAFREGVGGANSDTFASADGLAYAIVTRDTNDRFGEEGGMEFVAEIVRQEFIDAPNYELFQFAQQREEDFLIYAAQGGLSDETGAWQFKEFSFFLEDGTAYFIRGAMHQTASAEHGMMVDEVIAGWELVDVPNAQAAITAIQQ